MLQQGHVETFQKSLQRAGELWLLRALKSAEDPDGPNYKKQRGQVRNPGRGRTGKVCGDIAGRRDGASWLLLLAWHMPHKWSEVPWSTGNAGSVHMCREVDAGVGRQEEAQRQAQDESAVPADD